MDFDEYRKRGKVMIDYIADYLETIRERRVYPNVHPGYLRNLTPDCAPVEPESWDHIMDDVENIIMPGITHWQSPQMHAYFPALNSFPSLLGDMLADAINCLGFTWASSPACTELEIVVMNWLGKMIGLPEAFLHTHNESKGGGVIQTTSSEATFVCLLAARTHAIRRVQEINPELEDVEINSRLVAYCSDQAHSSVEKAGLIGLVKMRFIESDDSLSLRGAQLIEAIAMDKKQNLIPFFLCATLGTTGACAFDKLEELGPICHEENMWFHVDAAYAGTAFICPEFRHWLNGVTYADSIAFNPSKWMMVHFDCTAMWIRNSECLHRTFNVEPLYLQHENSGLAIDYMHWQIPLSKRFRALKLWFVIRSYGIKGLQKHIRDSVNLAKKFELLLLNDQRFEIPAARHLGLVVFRLCGENQLTERLLKRLNSRGRIHCVPASLKGKYVIRFTVTSQYTTLSDITRDWAEIKATATEIINSESVDTTYNKSKVSLADNVVEKLCSKVKVEESSKQSHSFSSTHKNLLKVVHFSTMSSIRVNFNAIEHSSNFETRIWNNNFGASLLLANSPMSPKVVNGSFAALFDNGDDWSRKILRSEMKDSSSMRRRIRGILMSGKQFSLDSRMDLVQGMVPTTTKKAICTSESSTNSSEDNSENTNISIESDDKEKNGEPRSSKPRIFRHAQHETSLTPLIEGNNTDLLD